MTYMELVQIVYNLLLVGGALLTIVVSISYLLSRSKRKDVKNSSYNIPPAVIAKRNPIILAQEQIPNVKPAQVKDVKVYSIDSRVYKDVKVLRKPTVSKREINETIWNETITSRTKLNGKRYTVVNEDMKKTNKAYIFNL